MRTQRITFDKVEIRGVRRWKDDEGRKHQQTRKFFQTISPFNRTADGEVKGREQIMKELLAAREAWLAQTPGAGT